MQQKLNMFQSNAKLFNTSGIIPSENINSSSWKSVLFLIFQIISFLLAISLITLQFLALYYYWGNINLMIDSIGFLAGFGSLYIIAVYIVIFWKDICKVFDTFETNSIFCNELVRSNQRHMKIFNDSLNLAQILNKAIPTIVFVSAIMYILPTFIQHLMTSDEEILQEAGTTDGFTKHFIFVMWLPPVLKQKFIIRVTYALQCICLLIEISLAAAVIPFQIVLLLYTGTQFKIISSIIREMDEVMCRIENSGDLLYEVPEQLFTTDRKTLSDSFQSPMPTKLPKSNMDEDEGIVLCTERQLTSKTLQNVLQEGDLNRPPERFNDQSSAEIIPTEEHDPASLYLLECIKLHQSCIKLAAEVSSILSPSLCIGALSITAFTLTNIFQLSLVINAKYAISTIIYPSIMFVYSWFGELVISESMGVGDTLYESLWYNRSKRHRGLLPMVLLRAQNPVYMKAGPLWKISVEFSMQLLNTMYTFFTVLRQLHNT